MRSPAWRRVRLFAGFLLVVSISAGCQRDRAPATGTAASGNAAATAGTPAAEPPAGGPAIAFDGRVHDFGVANEGAVLKHTFVVKNQGDAPLVLTSVTTSCGCTAAATKTKTIPPGGSGPIDVTFTTRGRRGAGSKTIRVTSNDRQQPTAELEIRYDVRQLVDLDPPFAHLNTRRGQDGVTQIWLVGTLAQTAEPRIAQVEGGDGHVTAKFLKSRGAGQVRKGVELRLRGKQPIAGQGNVTIATGLPNPAELTLGFQYAIE